jgi:tetratricopeptide (TPR) repeat protein
MSFFKSLFSKKPEYFDDKEFTEFFNDTINRYFSDPARKMKIETKDKNGNLVPPSHLYFSSYLEWKEIVSVWDKRSLIFNTLDSICLKHLEKWQFIERLIIDRTPDRALKFIREACSQDDFKNDEISASAARCYFFMGEYNNAIQFANSALEINSNNKRAKLILADSLHMNGEHKRSHDLYTEVLKESDLSFTDKNTIRLNEIFNFHNDIINSSVYAISLLKSSDEVNEEMWQLIAEEFYHCPFFRSQHSFWLFEKNENLKGIAKLINTAKEFPWYKEAGR